MKYDYNFYHQHLRRIKREQDIRVNELKKVISIIKSRMDYQHALSECVYHSSDRDTIYWNKGFDTACNSLITLLEACILDYEGKL